MNHLTERDEAIQCSGMPTSKTSIEMENHVYQKAKCRDEYLGFVARLILHVREMNTNKKAPGPPVSGSQVPQENQSVQDPINALRTLAHQGSGNQMMGPGPSQGQVTASNLLQSLNQRPILQNKMQNLQQNMNQMPQGSVMTGPMGNQMNMSSGNQAGQMMNPAMASGGGNINIPISMSNQIPGNIPMSVQMASGGPMQGQVGSQMNPSMSSTQLPNVLAPNQMGGPGQMPPQMSHMAQRKGPDGILISGQSGFMGSRGPVPNVFMRQTTPPPPTAQQQPSPAGITHSGSMVPSPAMAPSPNASQLTPNPSIGGPRPGSSNLAPSPSSSVSLNTPCQSQPIPSPSSNDDQTYHEKVRQLRKYIEPLRRMIARMGNNDQEKLSKMNKLLEILSTPGKRMPLETLLKCEVVLEKLDFKRQLDIATPSTVLRDPLLEAVGSVLQDPHCNHTLHRTFGPTLEALNGPPIANMPRPLKRKKVEESVDDIPDVLQGEIARLDQRFKVSLDPKHQVGSKIIHLLCWLDDRNLPCVPPIQITVPEDYPTTPPTYGLPDNEYNATTFLCTVKIALTTRVSKFPSLYSVSQLLDTWEISVRQACDRDFDPCSEDAMFEQFIL